MMFKKTKFMEWEAYRKHILFLDYFHFQQQTRKQSVENM